MTDRERRKGSGGRLTRSETVTVRLDPKLRYLADLAARKQRRTLSSYIEWAIEDSLGRTNLYPVGDTSIADEASALWDVDEADRFAKLALRHPELLTHEEQVRWKLIRENGAVWQGRFTGTARKWTWTVDEDSLVFERLRDHWADFCSAAESGTGHERLPDWVRTQEPPKTGFEDLPDDIPF
jgi:predicted transcriptional regulator